MLTSNTITLKKNSNTRGAICTVGSMPKCMFFFYPFTFTGHIGKTGAEGTAVTFLQGLTMRSCTNLQLETAAETELT